ncbi:MAG TPA: CHAT domain-containing protein, partial [Isosphaeraceae bacterium]
GFETAATRDLAPVGGAGSESGAGRSLVAEYPERVALHATASLLVSLVAAFVPGTSLPVALAEGAEIDVVVQPRRGLSLVGPGEGRLVVTGAEEGLPLQFKVRGEAPGRGLLRVLAFHQGRPLGLITLAPLVTESAEEAGAARGARAEPLAPATVRLPDLSLLILEARDGAETVLTLRLTSADAALGYNLKPFGPVRPRSDPYAYFQDFFRDIERLPIRTPADKARAELRLAAKGAGLFEALVPADLRRDLWNLRARITSVQVQSEEPWIPWELCKLVGPEGDGVEEGPFFCEAFELTRWLPGLAQVPRLGLRNLALVVPGDSGLAFAAEERDFVLSLAAGDRRVTRIPATFLDLHAALASGSYDGWHFTGHGSFRDEPNPDRSALILEGDERLTPEDLGGRVSNLGKTRPLVFLNACQAGQSQMALTGIGGWASRFLRAGAGGFLGAYWSVYDRPALDFARAFYDQLLAGTPLGRAARSARLAARASGDPTWLAYTVFADPLAIVAN